MKWKTAYITPVPKKGEKENVVNYRCIVKNSIFGKILDFLDEAKYSKYMRKYVIRSQHGFIPKRSTTSNLAVYSQCIVKNLKAKNQVDAIYINMREAFDKVDQKIPFKNYKDWA